MQHVPCNAQWAIHNSHRKKRMNHIKKDIAWGIRDADTDDPFELFISSTNIRYTYYKETEKVLGTTWGMCVLQVCPLLASGVVPFYLRHINSALLNKTTHITTGL
jgi:tRNA(Met) C34 N-acetyltransferase TmcA